MQRGTFSIFILMIAASLGTANANEDAGRVAILEQKVEKLSAELEGLKSRNAVLENKLVSIRALLDAGSENASVSIIKNERDFCQERLSKLRAKIDLLMSKGYTRNHPDMLNLSSQEATVSSECEALEAQENSE